ncbi:uncharacterized protein K02A2.6-like [Phymastichus coffea]|uniref:uncharacterized protein K02A2.6-like n=1 Tax=Phymastichus coffea TaxID=108790 RepID=UPI00273C33F6|nr:uncharacterized protein K02A2.6-like [Phymastichus coffea]
MASEATKLEFCLEKGDWDTFIERLENYFDAKDVPEAKRVPVFLMRLDNEAYKLIRDLCAPAKPKDKSFDELKDLFEQHLNPAPSEVMERHNFHQARQQQTESVADFAARLKKLAVFCNFKDVKEALRDQFVCGLRDTDTKIELFKKKDLTYDIAKSEALARERAVENAKDSMKLPEVTTSKDHVYKFKHLKKTTGITNNGQDEKNQKNLTCYVCGKKGHMTSQCKHKAKECNVCHRRGHLAAVCKEKGKTTVKFLEKKADTSAMEENRDKCTCSEHDFFSLRDCNDNPVNQLYNIQAEPMRLKLKIYNKIVEFEIDTGTYETVMSKITKDKFFGDIKLVEQKRNLFCYDDRVIKPLGSLENFKVEFNNKNFKLSCFVFKGTGPPLIGRRWLAMFGLWPLREFSNFSMFNINSVESSITNEFKILFGNTPGCFNKEELNIHLKENTTPTALKTRHVPYAMKKLIEQELDRLNRLGHIIPVEVSEWATPIVPIVKKNGTVRICGDFKLTLNPSVIVNKNPLPRIEDIFAAMQGGEKFSELDMPHAYMQIPVKKECQQFLTITTHQGLYRYTKMPEGVSTCPGEFQGIMENIIRGIPNTISYLDNIYVTGSNDIEHLENLKEVCKRMENAGLRINKEKCNFMKDKIDILGHVIDKNGLHKAYSKVKAVLEAPQPENKKQIQSFLGLVNFYAKFLPNRANKLKNLYECAGKEKFVWSKKCEEEFKWVKKEIVSPTILPHYDQKKELILACDASVYGLSAVLSHKFDDGTERPIAFASKKIPEKENSRAIIDKEAAAIVFGFKRFYDYIFGREITLRTDHKPLKFIFGSKTGIPLTAANRLQRWAYFLSGFKYNIEYIKSQQNGNCDALSRLPIEDDTDIFESDFTPLYYIQEGLENVNIKLVANETEKAVLLNKIKNFVINGWPKNTDILSQAEKIFFNKRLEISVDNGCLLWGHRLIIPEGLRPNILKELHKSHLGIVKIKTLARSYIWWPGIDADIEFMVNSCVTCMQDRKNPPKTELIPWPWPEKPWSRVHLDFLGPFYNKMLLVVIDAHSKWPEIIDFKTDTTAEKLICSMRKIFARHGLPEHIVSDNGRQFVSEKFKKFLSELGIKQSFSPPYHPATNGAAENFVGIFKDKINKIVKGGRGLDEAIDIFLFDYRSISHCTTGKSSAFLMYKRQLRTRFDKLRPSADVTVKVKQEAQIRNCSGSRNPALNVGDTVLADVYNAGNKKRVPAEIVERLTPSTFKVKIDDKMHKRHCDQLIDCKADLAVRRSERLASKSAENKYLKREEL